VSEPQPSSSERPDARTAHALRALFGFPVRITRIFGSLPRMGERERAESRGLAGSLNLRFTGDGAGAYHIALRDDRVRVHEGLDPDARTTVTLRARDFALMLAGRLDFTTAQMTGKVRLTGDGELLFMVGVIVAQFRRASAAPGPRGWPVRRFTRWVLRDVETSEPTRARSSA